jgi:hypothetical protein
VTELDTGEIDGQAHGSLVIAGAQWYEVRGGRLEVHPSRGTGHRSACQASRSAVIE